MAILFRAAAPVVNVSQTVRNALLKRTTTHVVSSTLQPHTSHLKAHTCNLQLQTTNRKTEEYNHRASFPPCTQQVGNNALRRINVGYASIYALQKEKHAWYKS